jgi:PTS system nitrogen regulatory IIA component
MNIASLITPDRIIPGLAASNKHRALYELSKQAAESLQLEPALVFDAIMAREKLGSTGVGAGTAIPHARLAGLKSPFLFFARLAHPIDFESVDSAPVDLVFFVLLPQDKDKENLTLLAEIAKRLRVPEFRAKLRAVSGVDELCRILAGSI